MGNVFVDLQGLKDNHDFVADCCRYSENVLSEEAIKKKYRFEQLIMEPEQLWFRIFTSFS